MVEYVNSNTETNDMYFMMRVGNNKCQYLSQGNNFVLNSNHTNKKFYITVQYTKITDSIVENTEKVQLTRSDYNMFKDMNSYLTTEHVVGTWTNGKPLYEKLLIINAPSDTDTARHWKDVYTETDTNIENMIIDFGNSWYQFTQNSSINKIPLTHYVNSSSTATEDMYFMMRVINNKCQYVSQGNNFIIQSTNLTNKKFYITIQYTKITDSIVEDTEIVQLTEDEYNIFKNMNSCLTTEHVIGKHTNNKPLYEKMLVINAPSDTDKSRHWKDVYTETDTNIENIMIDFGNSWYQFKENNNIRKYPLTHYDYSNATATSDRFFMMRVINNKCQYVSQGDNSIIYSAYTDKKFYITIQYTKVSDAVVE